MTWWSRTDSRDVDVVTGCFMLVRKEAIDQVGPMDERIFYVRRRNGLVLPIQS
jgi:GT2 family glycosyltransferase